MIAFSTCWNKHRHSDGEFMLSEIAEMGFGNVELSSGLNPSLMPGIKKAAEAGTVRVCGLHNFCPQASDDPAGSPGRYEFTSKSKQDRGRAIELTLKTIELAAEISARYVVVHFGSVPMRPATPKLEKMAAGGQLFSRAYVRKKLEAVKLRERLSPAYLKMAGDALGKIAERARELGVTIGIESRSRYEQVPSERELATLIGEFGGDGTVGYWHDFGHAQRKANLGFLNHHQWLRQMRPHLVGCHLNDVVWPSRDHMIPFEGSVDFADLMPLVPSGVPVVWELSYRRKKKNIIAALSRWRELFGTPVAA